MGKYGAAAAYATGLMTAGKCRAATEAWRLAMEAQSPGKPGTQRKSCPKATYLGLCEAGLVVGVEPDDCAAGRENKAYAVEAVRLLRKDPALADSGQAALWRRVVNGREKVHNHQMDVVLALWAHGLIVGRQG